MKQEPSGFRCDFHQRSLGDDQHVFQALNRPDVCESLVMEYMNALENGLDEQKPSLFEILAEQQLSGLIPPSLRYLLAIATHRHPRYLLRVLNSFDELYAVLSLVVERYYLRNYGGGFTENFYGLKRERVLRIKGGEVPRTQLGAPSEVRDVLKLRNNDVWKNLGVMVLLPYLKRKLDESYDIHAASVNLLGPSYRDREAYPEDGTVRQRIMWLYKWFLRKVYPSVNAAYYFSLLAFNLAYLFDGSKYDSPFLWLIGTRMRRLNDADRRAIASLINPKPAAPKPGNAPGRSTSIFHPRTLTAAVYSGSLSSLRILLPTSIFALKFLEWWHASDFARQLTKKANEGLELPPPIIAGAPPCGTSSQSSNDEKIDSRKDSGIANPPISSLTHLPILTVSLHATASTDAQDGDDDAAKHCPICLGEIQTATAAQTGYVYCYTCIYKWVDGTHPRQEAFMEGSGDDVAGSWAEEGGGSRVGKWESGVGRDAVTGRRVLGGTSGLRRVMI